MLQLGLLAFGLGGRRTVSVYGSLNPTEHVSAAPCYYHVKVRVRIFEQRRQGYQFYRINRLAVIILRIIIEHSYST